MALEWLEHNYSLQGGIPSDISAEELGEVVPSEIRNEVELYSKNPLDQSNNSEANLLLSGGFFFGVLWQAQFLHIYL